MTTVPPSGDGGEWPGYPGPQPDYPGGGQPPYPGGALPPYPGGGGFPPYPGGAGGPAPRPPAPTPVKTAAFLMYAGAAIGLINAIVQIADRSHVRRIIIHANPTYSAHRINTLVDAVIVVAVVGGLIGAGLWIWMAIANSRGHSWARIVASVFFGINTVSLIRVVAQSNTGVSKVLSVVVWAIGLAAVILLWQPVSSRYFNRPKHWS